LFAWRPEHVAAADALAEPMGIKAAAIAVAATMPLAIFVRVVLIEATPPAVYWRK
jgi:hypothetical protein